jgi:heme exporter protein B
VLALQFDLSASATGVLVLSLLLGTPILSLVGSMGAALTVGLRGSSVLLSLLVLPLTIPVLIFGAGAVEAHTAGLGVAGHFSLLGALLIVGLLAAPWVSAAALRISME